MAYLAEEILARSGSVVFSGDDGKAEKMYAAIGTGTESEALAAVLAIAPGTVATLAGTLNLQAFEYVQKIRGGYEIRARYGTLSASSSSGGGPRTPNSSFRSFDFSVEPVHLVVPRATTVFGPDPKPAPELIGDQNDGEPPEGCEGLEISAEIVETHYVPFSYLSVSILKAIEELPGSTNASTFRGRPANTCLLLGCSGQVRGRDDVEMTIRFKYKKHLTGETVLGVSGVDKRAWEFLWPFRKLEVDNERMKNKATHIVVNEIFPSLEWNNVLPDRSSEGM